MSKRITSRLVILAVLMALLAATRIARAQTVHVVQPGDSLFRIALQYGVSVQAIVEANNIVNPNLIIAGQELIIPGADAAAGNRPAPAQPPAAGAPPPATSTTGTGPVIHVVQPGDSLFRISATYGVPIAAIVAANNLANASFIMVGQQLVIPGATPSASAPPATTTGAAAPPPAATVPAPAAPPPAAASGNLFNNPSFEGDWYFYLYNELQVPDGWSVATDEGPVLETEDPNDRYFRPEIRVVSTAALPPNEHSSFIFDGIKTVKAFKGGAPTSFSMFDDVTLQPGLYRMTINFFPDIVAQYYPGGRRDYSTDPLASEVRLIHNNGGTDWSPATPGVRNTRTYDFRITQPETVRLGASFRSRFPAANNGYFLDLWTLERIGD